MSPVKKKTPHQQDEGPEGIPKWMLNKYVWIAVAGAIIVGIVISVI